MEQYVYDLECFDALFTGIFIKVTPENTKLLEIYEKADIENDDVLMVETLKKLDYKKFIITHDKSYYDLYDLVKFINRQDLLLYGFNNRDYDDLLLNAILLYIGTKKLLSKTTVFLREISDKIINAQSNYLYYETDSILKAIKYYKAPFWSIDLKSLNYLKHISLKFIGVLLQHYRIQDLPYHNISISRFDSDTTLLPKVITYNINDVLITKKLLHFSKNELIIRKNTYDIYGIDVFSDARPTLVNKLISHFYKTVTGHRPNTKKQTKRRSINIGELIEPVIKFKTDKFNAFKNKLASTTILLGTDKFNPSFIHKGIKYQLGLGGIHSADNGISIVVDDTYYLKDVDANSFYPFTILNYKVHPEHIPDIHYLPMLKSILMTRIEAKMKAKDKTIDNWSVIKATADILKIVVNIIYGKLGDLFHWLLDHKAMYKVTINCQLALLMLIEDLTEADFTIISANTDGIVSKVPKTRDDEYTAICEAWAKKLNYGVEYTTYKKYFATNVNNYIAIKVDGSIKTKGMFVKDKSKQHDFLTKGYSMPIIAIAVYDYFVHNKPISETIKNHKNIYDFCLSQRVGSDYTPYLKYLDVEQNKIVYKKLQRTIRYIVTTKGKTIVKINSDGKEISLLARKRLMLFNDFYYADNYNLDYTFYIREAYKLIDTVKRNTFKQAKKQSGKLFD